MLTQHRAKRSPAPIASISCGFFRFGDPFALPLKHQFALEAGRGPGRGGRHRWFSRARRFPTDVGAPSQPVEVRAQPTRMRPNQRVTPGRYAAAGCSGASKSGPIAGEGHRSRRSQPRYLSGRMKMVFFNLPAAWMRKPSTKSGLFLTPALDMM